MDHHPFSELFPLIKGEDFAELKDDIARQGLLVDIVTYQGKVLDGRSRERVCQMLNITPRYADAGIKSDDEALDLAVAFNLKRRYLTPEHRAFAAEKLSALRNARIIHSFKLRPQNLHDAAEQVGCSLPAAQRARIIINHGTPDDVANILTGKTPLATRASELHRSLRKAPRPLSKPSKPKKEFRTIDPSVTQPRFLTAEQVDPDFKGDALEFVSRHGHVLVRTAVQKASGMFDSFAFGMRAVMRQSKEHQWPQFDDYWLDKLTDPRERDLARLTEAVEYLEPKIAEARRLLDIAADAIRKKQRKPPEEK